MPPSRLNIPPLTRICLIASVFLSVLFGALKYHQWMARQAQDSNSVPSSSNTVVPFLTVVPSLSLFYPWTFVVAPLVESNIFTLAVTLATLFYGGKYLERAWGSKEFGKFLLVVGGFTNLVAYLSYILLFALTGDVSKSMATICGGVALQAGFLVAFKQLVPEHTVKIFKSVVKIRVKHFPAIYLLANLISYPLFSTDVAFALSHLGFLISWAYLRFFKISYPDLGTSESPQLRGDASETFSLAYFFPDPIHRPVAIVSDIVYNLLIALKICTPFSAADISAGNSRHSGAGVGEVGLSSIFIGPSGPGGPGVSGAGGAGSRNIIGGSARAEAERRRTLALKALDQRLHMANARAAGGAGSASQASSGNSGRPSSSNGGGPTVGTAQVVGSSGNGGSNLGAETRYVPDGDSKGS